MSEAGEARPVVSIINDNSVKPQDGANSVETSSMPCDTISAKVSGISPKKQPALKTSALDSPSTALVSRPIESISLDVPLKTAAAEKTCADGDAGKKIKKKRKKKKKQDQSQSGADISVDVGVEHSGDSD
ncbi:unnamed protein product [Protopolystoma xenopodis]|uniref:Uncharacterized protein n=1 Tax=Protopolystoma xenopodis TaxID=117903 RepID=A0A3S5A136_9PLAT|nr:unnamed protein product [Protopolystoma xenopodis]